MWACIKIRRFSNRVLRPAKQGPCDRPTRFLAGHHFWAAACARPCSRVPRRPPWSSKWVHHPRAHPESHVDAPAAAKSFTVLALLIIIGRTFLPAVFLTPKRKYRRSSRPPILPPLPLPPSPAPPPPSYIAERAGYVAAATVTAAATTTRVAAGAASQGRLPRNAARPARVTVAPGRSVVDLGANAQYDYPSSTRRTTRSPAGTRTNPPCTMPYEYTPASGIITARVGVWYRRGRGEPRHLAVVTWDAATDTIHMDVTNAPIVGDLYASLTQAQCAGYTGRRLGFSLDPPAVAESLPEPPARRTTS